MVLAKDTQEDQTVSRRRGIAGYFIR